MGWSRTSTRGSTGSAGDLGQVVARAGCEQDAPRIPRLAASRPTIPHGRSPGYRLGDYAGLVGSAVWVASTAASAAIRG